MITGIGMPMSQSKQPFFIILPLFSTKEENRSLAKWFLLK